MVKTDIGTVCAVIGFILIMGWFSEDMGQALRAKLFRRGNGVENVQAGSTFQRIHADHMIETAKVLSVADGPYGIPHVKFLVSFRRPNRNTFDEGNRMLALKTFTDRYREEVPA